MFEVQMPQAGQSMEEGTIVRWLKKEGDQVQSKDILFEVETDKAVVEVEAGHDGILRKIIVPIGQMVPIRTLVGLIGDANEPLPAGAGTGTPAPAVAQSPVVAAPVAAAPVASTGGGSLADVLMPQAGQSMEEGTIGRWLKKEGDTVQSKDLLLEVETDKAVVEVEAGHDGILRKIIVPAGTTVPVRTRIALIGDANAAIPSDIAAIPSKPAVAATPKASALAPSVAAPVAASVSGPIKASPAARKIAGERGIDLTSVGTGSGPNGRITSRDLPAQAAQVKPAAPVAVAAPASAPVSGQASRRRLSPMRKAIARNLLASKQNIPHFYMQLTINAAPMSDLQKAEKSKYQCSLNDFVTKACAKAIREFPAFRSRIENDEMVEFNDVNIGIAVGMDEGLVVPVILGADTLSIKELATETRRLAQSAKTGKIENMGKGVFTITNLGMYGIEQFTAIVNPPEAAIMAVGTMRETVVVQDGAMWPGKVMTMTLSADHRVVDGLPAAKFMARLKELLETPAQLL